jgi:fumarate reductase flavoprotein subunit
MSLSRRKCLQALLCSSVSLPLKAKLPASSPESWDLVIVGAGAAGLTAAIWAKLLGVDRVLILESEPLVGGSSIISGGLWAVSGTEMQKAHGISDSDADFFNDILEVGNHKNRIDVVKAFIRKNKEQYEWVTKTLGIVPKSIVPGAGTPRAHSFSMVSLIRRLTEEALKLGVAIRTGTRVTSLTTDAQGQVSGVVAEGQGVGQSFASSQGVILASGGFARNTALMAKFSPRMRFVTAICAQGSRGDGLLMARRLGAALADTEYLEGSYAFTRHPSTIADMTLLPYYGAIVVNQNAERFVNESLPYKQIAKVVLDQPRGQSAIVFDESIRRFAVEETLDRHLWEPIDRGFIPDYVVSDDSLSEAAVKAGLDPAALQKTVENYNRAISNSESQQPRGKLSVNNGQLISISHPPYFIMPASVSMLGTYGGLRIDGEGRVLREDDSPIPGLWAAGEVTGGFHGASFIMGTAIAKAMVFGRIAAESAAGRNSHD